MNQLPDVGYSEIKSHGDTITMLKIGNIEDAISFHSAPSDSNDMLLFIDYAPQVIPESWKALYDIDGSLYNDPARKQELETIGFKLLSEAEQSLFFSYGKESYPYNGVERRPSLAYRQQPQRPKHLPRLKHRLHRKPYQSEL